MREAMGPLHLHVWNAWLAELVDAADAFLEDPEGISRQRNWAETKWIHRL